MTEKKMAIIDEAEDFLNRNLNAIRMIKEGHSEKDAVTKNGLKLSTFRNMCLRAGSPPNLRGDVPTLSEGEILFATKYEKLFAVLMSYSSYAFAKSWEVKKYPTGYETISIPQGAFIPTDLDKRFPKVLKELSPRQSKIIRLRYFANKSLEEVGKIIGISRERTRQIEFQALRKMLRPHNVNYLIFGEEYNENRKKAIQNTTQKYADKVQEIYDRASEERKALIFNHPEVITSSLVENSDADLSIIDIMELGLSNRASNALYRAGFKTVADVAACSYDRLLEVKTLGVKSVDEIANVLKERFGIRIRGNVAVSRQAIKEWEALNQKESDNQS